MNNPLVSIIVPIYKAEQYINQCVDSILSQEYKNLEVILVDDGSPDNCPKICDEYAKNDSRVKVIHKENGGLSSAREAGISNATGKYVTIVDSDDWIDKETISVSLQKAEETDADCVIFSYVKEYPNSSLVTHIFNEDKSFVGEEVKNKVHRRLFGLIGEELSHPEKQDNIGSCCMRLYKTEFAKKGKFFDTKVVGSSEDTLFNIYALEDAKRVEYINKPFYHYRSNALSLTASYKPNFISQWNTLFDTMEQIIAENNFGEDYKNALNNRIALSVMLGIGLNELSNSEKGFFYKKRRIKQYLSTDRYRKAIKNFEFKYLPTSWKIFMKCCKYRFAFSLLLGLKLLKKLKGKIKRT